MHIELHTPGLRLPRGRAEALRQQVLGAFRRLAHRVERVVLSIAAADATRARSRRCSVEIHMQDGHVERIEERRRDFGTLLQHAIRRAWRAAARWLIAQRDRRPVLRLPTRAPALLPAPVQRRTD